MNTLNFILFAALVGTCFAWDSFVARNGKIYDPNNVEFLIRGVNSANADWDNYKRSYGLKSLAAIAARKANTIRVQWRMSHKNNDLDINHLKNILQKCKDLKMVAIVQLHDCTGSPDANCVANAAKWFASNMWLFIQFQRSVIINIVNEWSPHGTSKETWVNAYRWPIQHIRSAKWKGIILIDAPAYAQDAESIAYAGQQLVDADPEKNVAFSIHAYAEWKKGGRYQPWKHIKMIKDKGLSLIFGEFADAHPETVSAGNCPWKEMDWFEIMKQCKDQGIGYLGWSHAGNGYDDWCKQDLTPLNLVKGDQNNEWTWTNPNQELTMWGWRLYKTAEYGIEATSRLSTAF